MRTRRPVVTRRYILFMISTGIRDLKNNLSRCHYAALVASGPAIHRGDPLADWPSPEELSLPAGTVAKLLGEDRGDR